MYSIWDSIIIEVYLTGGFVMKQSINDIELYNSIFSNISNGIAEMVYLKLLHLVDKQWIFKGWITYPQSNALEFEMYYYDKETDEEYTLHGNGNISGHLILDKITVNFYIIDTYTAKAISFETDIDNKTMLLKIQEAINSSLENNRSYKYFCEDYKRYTHYGPFEYVKSLLNNQLVDFEETIYDEGCGITYRYVGEFGEDYIEIVIDDSVIDALDEEEYVYDFIRINVCDRLYFDYSQKNSKEIRELLPLLKQVTIPVDDFLVRISNRFCINKEHELQRIKALVCIDNGKEIIEVPTEAMLCRECNRYYISELEFEKLSELGRICCRVITLIEYKKIMESGYHSWAEKSLLRSYGYTVSAQEGLSDVERHRILSFIIENEIMTIDEIISFIEWLIKRNKSSDFYYARQKWSRDINYVRNYKTIAGVVRVKDIYIKDLKWK